MKCSFVLLFLSIYLNINCQNIEIQCIPQSSVNTSNLIGFNTGFDHRHWVEKETQSGITTYTSTIRQDLSDILGTLSKPVLRFPGGVIANFYHLYPAGFECNGSIPCTDAFSKGYGLRSKEVQTFNNGFGSVGNEYNFENSTNRVLTENWIVTFANMVETLDKDIEIVYMANVLAHFKFGNQSAQFNGNEPNVNSDEFQQSLNETAHALRYLIDVRGLKVTKLEMGTELYFSIWSKNNGVSVDRFINLIPVYRDLLDQLGYDHIEIGVPFSHKHALHNQADNWSRKLADKSYHSNLMFDDWIIHDYQRMVKPCKSIFNCNSCTNWVDNECSLYNGNPNILNCEPDKHSPTSEKMEAIYKTKKEKFATYFNQELADEYEETLLRLRQLSGKNDSKLWLTEWNLIFDAGCSDWKGINKFFPNTFLHGVSIFEILQTMNKRNLESNNNFVDVTNFHTFSAPNNLYPIVNAKKKPRQNITYYPFQMSSIINKLNLKVMDNINNADVKKASISTYVSDENQGQQSVYIFFTNKTNKNIPVSIDLSIFSPEAASYSTRYIQADALHSAINGEYICKDDNITVDPINTTFAMTESNIDVLELPSYSFGYIHAKMEIVSTKDESLNSEIIVYPNPTNDKIYFKEKISDFQSIELINMFGQMVIKSNYQSQEINLSHLPSGMYIVLIKTKGGILTSRIYKR